MKKRFFWGEEEDTSEDDMNLYSASVRETLLEEDAIDPFEDAFVRGYEEF